MPHTRGIFLSLKGIIERSLSLGGSMSLKIQVTRKDGMIYVYRVKDGVAEEVGARAFARYFLPEMVAELILEVDAEGCRDTLTKDRVDCFNRLFHKGGRMSITFCGAVPKMTYGFQPLWDKDLSEITSNLANLINQVRAWIAKFHADVPDATAEVTLEV
jgi:hypothetical protein